MFTDIFEVQLTYIPMDDYSIHSLSFDKYRQIRLHFFKGIKTVKFKNI